MRVQLQPPPEALVPGEPVTVPLEVTNGLSVIDGLQVVADAQPGLTWSAEPSLLPLFPDGSGRVTLSVTADPGLPAGHYQVPVEVRSTAAPATSVTRFLPIEVRAAPGLAVSTDPVERSGRSRCTFSILCRNTGNVPLDVELAATDADRALTCRFDRPVLTVPPGATGTATLTTRTRRHLFGGNVAHQARVVAAAPQAQAEAVVTFTQRPVVPRGARTIALLAAIVGVWAAIVVIALSHALGSSPLQKAVPASFYATTASRAGATGHTPAGAVPKSGLDVAVGGTLSGTVDAASTGAGIGRITVQAYAVQPDGTATLQASTASGSDGSWSIPGLLPGPYRIELSAQGFTTEWYPSSPSETGAQSVQVRGEATTGGLQATVTGLPGSISGTVQTGEQPAPPVTVTVVPQQGAGSGTALATVTTTAQGTYAVSGIPTPGTYDLSFTSPGFQPGTDVEVLTGGQQDIAATITLTAATGSISGTVSGAAGPLGGVTVTAAANGTTYRTATPTTGQIGTFTLGSLPSPATYLLTFSAPGYGTDTVAQQLGPGQELNGLAISLAGGAGDVSGTVDAAGGGPLGGVTVTVTGAAQPVTTQTLTAGQVGTYQLTGLSTPGQYTLTFSLTGYVSVTIPVGLASGGSAGGVDATLSPASGSIDGTVTAGGAGASGAAITVTDGGPPLTTTTTSDPAGGFSLAGVAPGQYSVTATLAGYEPDTVQVTVTAGQAAQPQLTLTPVSDGGSSSSGSSGSGG